MDTIRKMLRVPLFEKMLAYPPKKPGSLLGKILPGNYLYPLRSIRKWVKNGIRLELDLSDYLQHYLYFNYSDKSLDKLCSLAKPGMIILDIGANIGYLALRLAKKVGNEGRIYSFEPDADNYKKAVHNINELNPWCNNIYIENMGLGDKKGQYKLFIMDELNNGMHQVHDYVPDKPYSIINIEVLDEYVSEKQMPAPGLIKIDTEGYEMNILKGAVKTIVKYKPVLFIELDDNNLRGQNSSAKEIVTFLKAMGYILRGVEDDKEIALTDNFANCHFDCICYPG